jgi:hypothetical protein
MTLLPSLAILAMLATGAMTDSVSLGRDFHVGHKGWNGLSELKRLSEDLGCPIQVRRQLDWSSLDGQDVLLVLHPESELDETKAVAFLTAGGRMILADDYGKSERVLAKLGIRRQSSRWPAGVRWYRPDESLPIATPVRGTALGKAASELLANHSAYFVSGLPATYAFAPGAALVVEAGVGHGRLVAIADPSVFINNMLELPGNREFAAQLIVDICRLQQDRLVLLYGPFAQLGTPPAALMGAPASDSGQDLPDKLNRALGGANLNIQQTLKGHGKPDDPEVITLIGLLFCIASLLLFLKYLPLPGQPQDSAFAQPQRPPDTGLFASVQRYAGGAGQVTWGYIYPATLIREETLLRLLPYLPPSSDGSLIEPKEVRQALTEKVSPRAGELGWKLWKGLRSLREGQSPSSPGQLLRTQISERKLAEWYKWATELFAELDHPSQGTDKS